MNESIIALDTLSAEKHMVKDLTHAISETSNQNLKETLKQIRNRAEQSHHQIYQIAEQNGWYMPAGSADSRQINNFHQFFQQNLNRENEHPQQMENQMQGQHNQYQNQQADPSPQNARQYTYQGNQSSDPRRN